MTREEAIEEIKSWTPFLMGMGSKCTEETTKAQSMAIEALEEQRPHGEWLQQYKNDGKWHDMGYFYNMYKCSNCGSNGSQLWHFCPNCGADMRKRVK